MIIIRQRWNTWHTAGSDKHKMIRRQLCDHQKFDQMTIVWSDDNYIYDNLMTIQNLPHIKWVFRGSKKCFRQGVWRSDCRPWWFWRFDDLTIWQFDNLTIWQFDDLTIWRSDNLTIWRGAKMQISKCRTEHLKHAPLIKAAMKNPKIIGRKYLLVMMMLLVIFIDGHCWQKKLLTVGIICQATKKWNTQISKVLHKAQASTTGPTKNLNFTSAIRVFFFCPVLFCFVLILHIPGTFAVDFQLFHCKQFEEFNYQSIADFMQSKWAAV